MVFISNYANYGIKDYDRELDLTGSHRHWVSRWLLLDLAADEILEQTENTQVFQLNNFKLDVALHRTFFILMKVYDQEYNDYIFESETNCILVFLSNVQ